MVFRKFRKNKIRNTFVEPDEIFLDSKNLQNLDRQQFEGRIEKPIPKKTVVWLGIFFLLIILTFGVRLVHLQIQNGENYRKRSENNMLEKAYIFNERGIIYDRNKKKLAWNKKNSNPADLYTRAYQSPGFSHVLGYVSYPTKDNAGVYWQSEFEGIDGLEKEYQNIIKGENGSKIIEVNALREIQSENIINIPKQGKKLNTSLDSRIQSQLLTFLKNLS